MKTVMKTKTKIKNEGDYEILGEFDDIDEKMEDNSMKAIKLLLSNEVRLVHKL